jgi:hypothetical protein
MRMLRKLFGATGIIITVLMLAVSMPAASANSAGAGIVTVNKYNASVKDSTITAYTGFLTGHIPVALRDQFIMDGGDVSVFSEYEYDPVADTSGWSGGGKVIAYFEWMTRPQLMISTRPVERAGACKKGLAEMAVCHEFGHYVNVRSSMIKSGKCDYVITGDFRNAYNNEKNNYQRKDCALSTVMVWNMGRVTDPAEYYANIFAGLMIEPAETMRLFPASPAAVLGDIDVITRYHDDDKANAA